MAWLASRYTQINVLMKVHVGALYQFQQSFPSHSARRRLPEAARVEVLLWRAFLLSLSVNPAYFARPFRSFRARTATHTIGYDASVTRVGVLVSLAPLVFCWGTPCYLPHSWQRQTRATRTRMSTSLYSSDFFSRRDWGSAMVSSLCLGIVGRRWRGCCKVEHGLCYVDVQVSTSQYWR